MLHIVFVDMITFILTIYFLQIKLGSLAYYVSSTTIVTFMVLESVVSFGNKPMGNRSVV